MIGLLCLGLDGPGLGDDVLGCLFLMFGSCVAGESMGDAGGEGSDAGITGALAGGVSLITFRLCFALGPVASA